MEEEEDMLPPFWQQTTDTPRHRRLRGRHSSSLFLNSGLLLVLLLVIALFFICIVIPSFLNFTSQIFRPHVVKKSWDSLNLVLVLFAIVCGFLSRNNNNNESTSSYEDPSISNSSQEAHKSTPSTSNQWYRSDRREDSYNTINGLRSSSSYPDLRQESTWMSHDERWKFYDDTQVSSNYRFPSSDQLHHRHPRQDPPQEEGEEGNLEPKNITRETFVVPPAVEEDSLEPKNIPVDTFVASTKEVPSYKSPPPPLPSSPPPQPPTPPSPLSPFTPPKVVKYRKKRTYQTLGHEEKIETSETNDSQVKNLQSPPSPPPPPWSPPPPPPPTLIQQAEQNSGGKNEKKRGGSATKDFLNSLRRKKKKQRQKSVENFDNILNSQPSPSLPLHPPPSPPPPPPPLPPPPSVFHNFFTSKKGKIKKVHSVSPPPPKAKARKPPLPVNTRSFNSGDDNASSGNESPLNPIPPPPPPPPPFKMRPWKFELQGDYVRIKSTNSSRSGSPDSDNGEDSPTKETGQLGSEAVMDGGDSTTMPMFCSSPDVDTKADSFIAKFRADLMMQKMNSFKEKQGRRRSNLGPEPSPKKE